MTFRLKFSNFRLLYKSFPRPNAEQIIFSSLGTIDLDDSRCGYVGVFFHNQGRTTFMISDMPPLAECDVNVREMSIEDESSCEGPRKWRKRGRMVTAATVVIPIPISIVDKTPTLVVA